MLCFLSHPFPQSKTCIFYCKPKSLGTLLLLFIYNLYLFFCFCLVLKKQMREKTKHEIMSKILWGFSGKKQNWQKSNTHDGASKVQSLTSHNKLQTFWIYRWAQLGCWNLFYKKKNFFLECIRLFWSPFLKCFWKKNFFCSKDSKPKSFSVQSSRTLSHVHPDMYHFSQKSSLPPRELLSAQTCLTPAHEFVFEPLLLKQSDLLVPATGTNVLGTNTFSASNCNS